MLADDTSEFTSWTLLEWSFAALGTITALKLVVFGLLYGWAFLHSFVFPSLGLRSPTPLKCLGQWAGTYKCTRVDIVLELL